MRSFVRELRGANLIGAGLAVIVIGLFVFRHVETYAKRTGRLKRSG